MEIVELAIQNLMRVKAVVIRPDGRPVMDVTGRNSQGKTTVLKSIMIAMKGKVAAPPKIIREGAEECTIKLDIGEFTVLREFKTLSTGEVTSRLTLTRADGSRVGEKPQAILDALCGSLAFNPIEFSTWEPKKQFDALRQFVKGFDFADYEDKRKAAYESRTEWNRKAETSQAAADKITTPPGPKPEPIVAADILAQIEQADKHNRDIEERILRRKQGAEDVDMLLDDAERLQAEVNSKKKKAAELAEKLEKAPPLPLPISTAELRQKLVSAEVINATIRAHDSRDGHRQEATTAKAESEAKTATIKSLDAAKAKAIASAEMPVKGLDLVDGAVSFNGIPFEQASTSEKIRVSMAIAMKMNPKLRVVLIDEASSLDKDARALIAKIAEEHDFTVWMTRVTDGEAVGIQIENGEIVPKGEIT